MNNRSCPIRPPLQLEIISESILSFTAVPTPHPPSPTGTFQDLSFPSSPSVPSTDEIIIADEIGGMLVASAMAGTKFISSKVPINRDYILFTFISNCFFFFR